MPLSITRVFSSTTDAWSSVFRRPGSSLSAGAADELLDRGRRHQRFRVDDHDLLFDSQRERRALAEAVLDHVLIPWTGRPAASHA